MAMEGLSTRRPAHSRAACRHWRMFPMYPGNQAMELLARAGDLRPQVGDGCLQVTQELLPGVPIHGGEGVA